MTDEYILILSDDRFLSLTYYHHLFTTRRDVTERWFARVARLLRAERRRSAALNAAL